MAPGQDPLVGRGPEDVEVVGRAEVDGAVLDAQTGLEGGGDVAEAFLGGGADDVPAVHHLHEVAVGGVGDDRRRLGHEALRLEVQIDVAAAGGAGLGVAGVVVDDGRPGVVAAAGVGGNLGRAVGDERVAVASGVLVEADLDDDGVAHGRWVGPESGSGIGVLGGDAQGGRDVGLRGAPARLQDVAPALGLADTLQSRRRSRARPGAGRLGQRVEPLCWSVTGAPGGTVPGASGDGSR